MPLTETSFGGRCWFATIGATKFLIGADRRLLGGDMGEARSCDGICEGDYISGLDADCVVWHNDDYYYVVVVSKKLKSGIRSHFVKSTCNSSTFLR